MVEDCIFCKIIDKKIPARFEYEDSELVAIQDIHPQAPVHLLVIPRKHISDINAAQESDCKLLGGLIHRAKLLAQHKKVEDGYRLVLNNGSKAGQSVFHVHLHLLGGRPMTWPPG
ncbi:MAG: histidine triad nucleotide-binding protein [Candidatus Omnitrophica bacterium]|nr:histidine triad nucleotide-binding protein [Candidatus Omnitrophota bacterium]